MDFFHFPSYIVAVATNITYLPPVVFDVVVEVSSGAHFGKFCNFPLCKKGDK